MTAPDPPPAITDDELLARFMLFSRWIREDRTLRPDGFMPSPNSDLSVTRQFGLSEVALWQIGQAVADSLQKILYGRADLKTADVRRQRLQVDAAPLSENLNHANITGWPPDKPSRKIIAQELAASATFVARE